MFSITLKRSAATLGVVAGLLAAAGPAGAQVGIGTMGLTTPHSGSNAPRANSSEIAVESLTQARNLNDVEAIDFNALGGANDNVLDTGMFEHEWLKAPTKADDRMKDNVKAVVVLIGANDYGFVDTSSSGSRE